MIPRILFFYNKSDLSHILLHLNQSYRNYQVITTSESLKTFLINNKINSKTLQELFPDSSKQTYEINHRVKDKLHVYRNSLKMLTLFGHEVFTGIENQIMDDLILIEKTKKILSENKDTIFIFENFSFAYFTIKNIMNSSNNNETHNELEICRLQGQRIINVKPNQRFSDLINRNRLNFLKNSYFPQVSSSTQLSNKVSLSLYPVLKIISAIIRSKLIFLLDKECRYSVSDVIESFQNKLHSATKSREANVIFFITNPRDDIMKSIYPLIEKFKSHNVKFQIFTVDLLTNSVLSRNDISSMDLFEEVYVVAQAIRHGQEAIKLEEKLRDVCVSNDLTLIYLKEFSEQILNEVYRSIAIMMIAECIIKNCKLKSIVVCLDGTMLSNCVTAIAKKYKIPNYSIQTVLVGNNPLLSNLYKADKICVYGLHGYKILEQLGYDKDKIILTGNPRYDYVKNLNIENARKTIAEKYSFNTNQKLVVIAMSRWHANDEEWIYKLIRFCNAKNLQLILKIHPLYRVKWRHENEERIKLIKKMCKNEKYQIIYDIDTSILLPVSDIVITDYSNVGIEAILLNKPLLTVDFNYELRADAPRYHEYGAAINITKYEALENTILDILQGQYTTEVEKKDIRIADLYNYKNDGKATERIFNILMMS